MERQNEGGLNRAWTGFIWPRIWSSDGLLWIL